MASITKLTDASAVHEALAEFRELGRSRFLNKYGFGRSLAYMIRDTQTGELFDSKAIAGVAFGYQFPGLPELVSLVDWISDRLGDGAGYDIASFRTPSQPRNIEVKTTNGGVLTPFVLTANELDASEEMGDVYHLYRVYDFRRDPHLFILQGNLRQKLALEPMDYRARLKSVAGS